MSAIIHIDGLAKTYVSPRTGEEAEALRDIDLEIGEGEFVAIVGPPACGTSVA